MKWTTVIALLTISTSAFAADLATGALPRSNRVRAAADKIGGKLRDEVISSGVLNISAWELTGAKGTVSNADLAKFSEANAKAMAKRYSGQALPAGFKFETSVKPFDEKLVDAAAKIMSDEVNVYDPKAHEEKRMARNLWVILNELKARDGDTVVFTSRGVYNDEGDGKKHLTVTGFLNQKTRSVLLVYMVEGSM